MAKKHTVQVSNGGGDTASRAMLLKITIHHWKGKRHDRRISDEVADRYQADANMGSYLKQLVAKERLQSISILTSKIRDLWYERTLPWIDEGTRIVPNSLYLKTREEIDELVHQRQDAVNELALNWEEVVAEAKVRLNGLFLEDDYPSAKVLRDAYRIDIVPMAFPSGADFRLGVLGPESEQDEAALRAEVDAKVKDALADATRDVWQRVHDVTEKMADRLSAFSPIPQRKGDKIDGRTISPFRDTLVENVRDLVELLPALNVAGDPILAGLTDKISKRLCQHDAEELRQDPKLRQKTAKAAQEILDHAKGFLG